MVQIKDSQTCMSQTVILSFASQERIQISTRFFKQNSKYNVNIPEHSLGNTVNAYQKKTG